MKTNQFAEKNPMLPPFLTQTESKGNLIQMALCRHLEACCHFAPPTRGVQSLRALISPLQMERG